MNIKKAMALIVLVCWGTFLYSQEEKHLSIQGNPITYLTDIVWLFVDRDINTFALATDVEFQYALNRYYGFSLTNSLYFERYLNSFFENSNGRYDEDYGSQFQIMFNPAFVYRPFGTRLKGLYISAFPIIGWTYVSTQYLNDSFTHLGLGLSSGYQWIFRNGFTLQLGAGISRAWVIPFRSNKGPDCAKDEWHLFGLPVDLNYTFRVGYSF
jgi:hypothetical protein